MDNLLIQKENEVFLPLNFGIEVKPSEAKVMGTNVEDGRGSFA